MSVELIEFFFFLHPTITFVVERNLNSANWEVKLVSRQNTQEYKYINLLTKLTFFVLYHVLVFFRYHQTPSAVFTPVMKEKETIKYN